MVESHCDPDRAWSDAKQQITPKTLIQFMKDWKTRKLTVTEESYQSGIKNLRAKIDVIDQSLLDLLGDRMKVAEKIGELKKTKNVAVLQNKRWNEILGKMILEGEERGLGEEFILRMFKAIHQESINHQQNIFKS